VVNFINETDHFASCYWPEPTDDRYVFMLEDILRGLRSARHFSDHELVEFGMICLDAVYTSMKIKASAEEDLATNALEFESRWGKGLAMENKNDEAMKLAQKQGFQIAVRKDEVEGFVRVKAVPDKNIDLTPVYEKIIEKDSEGTWYLHPSKAMLLNGSKKHGKHKPTTLSLKEVVAIIEEIV
jgi:hypothetical protein